MNIVVLDGYTTNPGDLSWDILEQFGSVMVYDYTAQDEITQRCRGMDLIISNKTVFNGENMSKLGKAKYIGLMSTGYNVVDIESAKKLGITVTNVPAYSTDAVAQHTFALILELCSKIGVHNQAVHNGEWSDHRRFCFWKAPLTELNGKTIGIVGFGRIGRRVSEIAKAFGLNVIFYSRSKKSCGYGWQVTMEALLRESDIVTLHCPLTPETKELINDHTIALMKPAALLINTARGPIINDAAVASALNSGRLSGAGLDVLTTEPPESDNPLLTAKNCVISPHIAWAAIETRKRMLKIVAENIKHYLAGNPVNTVS